MGISEALSSKTYLRRVGDPLGDKKVDKMKIFDKKVYLKYWEDLKAALIVYFYFCLYLMLNAVIGLLMIALPAATFPTIQLSQNFNFGSALLGGLFSQIALLVTLRFLGFKLTRISKDEPKK